MSKHTPGPWHLYARNELCIESPSGNVALCNLARHNVADAKLIAAAPDLAAALHQISIGASVAHDGLAYSEIAEIASKALAKAGL